MRDQDLNEVTAPARVSRLCRQVALIACLLSSKYFDNDQLGCLYRIDIIRQGKNGRTSSALLLLSLVFCDRNLGSFINVDMV